MSLIGITGGIGSGKTFISRMFNSSEAFVVFNSDLFAKQILVENSEVIDFVKNKIGEKSYKDGIIQTKYISNVIFNDKRKLNELNKIVIEKIGIKIQKSDFFQESVNVDFATILEDKTIRMKVWERGAGRILACGSGACATLVAANQQNL